MTPIAVVVVNYNTRDDLRACLSTIIAEVPRELIVVDNASSDGSVEMVQAEFPAVTVHANKTNVGYGAASNQGIVSCKASYVLLLNADTLLQPGALRALSTYLDLHPQAAIVGPRLVGADGILQASSYPFPTPLDTFLENSSSAVIIGRYIRRHIPAIRTCYLRTWAHDFSRIVPWLKGAALAIRCDAYREVGGFDPSFFMYFEDADLCFRLRASGWESHFAPVTTVTHVGGASSQMYRTEMEVQLLASTFLFYKRHYSKLRQFQMLLIIKSLMLTKWFCALCKLKLSRDPAKRNDIAEKIEACRIIVLGDWTTVEKRAPA